jgi:hypothetical protein
MKNLVKKIALSLLVMATFAACKKEDADPKTSNCSGKLGKTTTVKVDAAICGYGVWGGLWLMPTDSRDETDKVWLQPYSLEDGINYTPKKGEILKITYRETQFDDRYNNIVVCLAYPGKSIPIHILCIESDAKADATNVSTSITKKMTIFKSCSGIGVFGEKWLYDAQTNTYLQPCKWIGKTQAPAFDEMNNGDTYEVTYTLSSSTVCQDNFTSQNNCFAAPPKATPIDIWTMDKVK